MNGLCTAVGEIAMFRQTSTASRFTHRELWLLLWCRTMKDLIELQRTTLDNCKRTDYDAFMVAHTMSRLQILLILVVGFASQLSAKVGEVDFSSLVQMSNEIVLENEQ